MPIHIRPTAPLADRALLPSDPGLALGLAEALLDGPRMFNHARGLWGYTGLAADGLPITIQSTGIGGPSAAIVLGELIGLGLVRAIRVGTCTSLAGELPQAGLGELLLAEAAACADGTSRALGAGRLVAADVRLTDALAAASPAARRGLVVSRDLLHPWAAGDSEADRPGGGALAFDLETAALLRVGELRGVAVACVLVVAERTVHGRAERLDDEPLARACELAGRLAAGGLAAGEAS